MRGFIPVFFQIFLRGIGNGRSLLNLDKFEHLTRELGNAE